MLRRYYWVVSILASGTAIGGDTPPTVGVIALKNCEIEYERVTILGAFVVYQAGGRVQDCYVRPGDRVKAGQVLGRLHDRDAVFELEKLRLDARSDIDLRIGEAKFAVASAKVKRSEQLHLQNYVSREDLTLHRQELKEAALDVEQAKFRIEQSRLAAEKMAAEVRSREFVSPAAGVVVEIMKNVAESCMPNDPVMKVVHDDRMWVTGYLDTRDAWRARVGQLARVRPDREPSDVALGGTSFPGRVIFIDPRIDPANQTSKVVVEIDNPEHSLRSGLKASMEIELSTAPLASSSGKTSGVK